MSDAELGMQRTPLYEKHLAAGGKMVDFAGWKMPINYGSQVKEHNQVREDAGMFDVTHMVILDLAGKDIKAYLRNLLANDVDKLKENGKALYSGMLNADGGVIDDLIIYYLEEGHYRMVVNAATRQKDILWMLDQINGLDVDIAERYDLAMIAVQGPKARQKIIKMLAGDSVKQIIALKPFFGVQLGDAFFARTGYTGEDGFEIMMPVEIAEGFWDKLAALGVKPIGLGARDTLRLEAGMNLYGSDMDETISPLQAAMGWTVAWEPEDRDFIGRKALEEEKKNGIDMKLVGLVLEDKGVLRGHQKVITEHGDGETTSGSFSPTLGVSIAFARIPSQATNSCFVEVRGKQLAAKIVKPPFVRNGKSLIS